MKPFIIVLIVLLVVGGGVGAYLIINNSNDLTTTTTTQPTGMNNSNDLTTTQPAGMNNPRPAPTTVISEHFNTTNRPQRTNKPLKALTYKDRWPYELYLYEKSEEIPRNNLKNLVNFLLYTIQGGDVSGICGNNITYNAVNTWFTYTKEIKEESLDNYKLGYIIPFLWFLESELIHTLPDQAEDDEGLDKQWTTRMPNGDTITVTDINGEVKDFFTINTKDGVDTLTKESVTGITLADYFMHWYNTIPPGSDRVQFFEMFLSVDGVIPSTGFIPIKKVVQNFKNFFLMTQSDMLTVPGGDIRTGQPYVRIEHELNLCDVNAIQTISQAYPETQKKFDKLYPSPN